MNATMRILRAEHNSIAFLLGLLETQARLLEKTGQPDLELITEITDYFRSFPDLHHHPKEDIVLRRLRQRAPGLGAEILDLESEHEDLSDELQSFSRAVVALFVDPSPMTRADFLKSAGRFIEHEREHMAIEERFFFPAAEKWLTEEDWSEINEAVSHFVDPLMAPDASLRYFSLREKMGWWHGDEVA